MRFRGRVGRGFWKPLTFELFWEGRVKLRNKEPGRALHKFGATFPRHPLRTCRDTAVCHNPVLGWGESTPQVGDREQGDGQDALRFARTPGTLPWLKCFLLAFCPLLPRAAFVHGGAFSGLPGSCDECLLVACIHPPSEALARLLIKPPSGRTVLSGSSTPCLLLLVNELAAKAC